MPTTRLSAWCRPLPRPNGRGIYCLRRTIPLVATPADPGGTVPFPPPGERANPQSHEAMNAHPRPQPKPERILMIFVWLTASVAAVLAVVASVGLIRLLLSRATLRDALLICDLAAIGFGAASIISYNAQRREAAQDTFMQECVMDHKRY